MRMDRRAFMQGKTSASQEVHISSLVVHCRPDSIDRVKTEIEAIPEAEVPEYSDEGKLVVLLETSNESRIMQRISTIENLAGVISAALVYHQIDSETGEIT